MNLDKAASMACPVCRSSDVAGVWQIAAHTISRCPACTHQFVSSEIEPGVLGAAYERDYYRAVDESDPLGYIDYLGQIETRSRSFRARLRELERHFESPGRLLDYGCAVGLFVKVAKDSGWDAIGYERSAWAAEYGRQHFDITIKSETDGNFDFEPETFDLVTMWDVLEHLEHPRDVLEKVASWLKPGGMLAFNTVNSGSVGARMAGQHWRHLAPPHHLQYFTRRSLQKLLAGLGFRVVSHRTQGVCLGADRRRLPVQGWRAFAEDLSTHWRIRWLVDRLQLLDEIEFVAILARPSAQEGAALSLRQTG